MMDLYYRADAAPAALPAYLFDTNGNAFSAPFAAAFVTSAGYTLAPPKPADTATQLASWDASAKKWVMFDRPPPPELLPTPPNVDGERDRRINAGITFNGTVFQTDDRSRTRIEKARVSAITALQSGVQAGDLKWTGVGTDFFWIALDNTRVPMDAPTTVAFGSAVAAREGLIIVAASDLKKRIEAGEAIANVGDNALWP